MSAAPNVATHTFGAVILDKRTLASVALEARAFGTTGDPARDSSEGRHFYADDNIDAFGGFLHWVPERFGPETVLMARG